MDKLILDVCCGSKMFWFDKNNENVVFMDNRILHDTLCDGRKLDIEPDIMGDFRNIPFDDNTFQMVVFDPPHLLKAGENSWLAKKYGRLSESWTDDLQQGFFECMRVLKPGGTLIFKWNEQQIRLNEILKAIDYKPLFGNKRSNTHWLVFMKQWVPDIKINKLSLQNSKKAICDWIMGMTVKEYFDFMDMVLENTQIPVIETITEEMFYSCRQCDKEHGEECEKIGTDDLSKCFRFFCEHYGIREVERKK